MKGKCEVCKHQDWKEIDSENFTPYCVLKECRFELKEVNCCHCGNTIENDFHFIRDNHYVANAYKNVHPSEMLDVFCSDSCITDSLYVETLDVESED